MSSRGRIQFKCAECACAFRPERKELIRAAGVKCPGCGSRFVDISKMGADRIAHAQDATRANQEDVERKTGGASAP